MPAAPRIRALLDEMLTADKVAGELDYLDRAYTGGFERPYGWAWLLMLHAEAQRHEAAWADALAPLAEAFAERFKAYPAAGSPTRSAPAPITTPPSRMVLALDWADANDTGLGGADPRPRAPIIMAATAPARAGSRAATISCRRR